MYRHHRTATIRVFEEVVAAPYPYDFKPDLAECGEQLLASDPGEFLAHATRIR